MQRTIVPFQLKRFSKGRIYYPACRFDGRPVKCFGGFSHSFIYVDLFVKHNDLLSEIDTFKGYHLVFNRPLKLKDLCIKPFEAIMPLYRGHQLLVSY